MEKDASYCRIPRLSDEALKLFFERGGFVGAEPVDLRSLVQSGHSVAVTRAALAWRMSPDRIVID